jgi:molybdate transport system permease protein
MSGFLQRIDWPPLLLSLKVASLATLLASIAGIALGWLFARRRFPGSAIVEAACMLPLVLPPTVIGYDSDRRGPAQRARQLAPCTVRLHVRVQLARRGARVDDRGAAAGAEVRKRRVRGRRPLARAAARTLRQSPFSTFVRVTLPLAWPAILAGALLAFARAMGEFGATLMIAGDIPRETQTLSLAIYDAMQDGRDGTAFFLACVTSVLSVAVLVLSKRFFTLR